MVKNPPTNVGDTGLIPGSGRPSGEGNGKPLQNSCLENPMDRGAWRAAGHGVTESRTRLSNYYCCHSVPGVQAGFRKGRRDRDQIANSHWTIEKAREFQKNICFCFIDYAKAFIWITTNCGKFLKSWEYQTTWPASWETCMQVRKQQLELDMEQQTGSKSGKEYHKAVYCHLLI